MTGNITDSATAAMLLRLGRVWAWNERRAEFLCPAARDSDLAWSRLERCTERRWILFDRISELPATTLEGVYVKLRCAEYALQEGYTDDAEKALSTARQGAELLTHPS